MSVVGETCPKCKGSIPENRILTTPDPDPYGPSSVRTFTYCSACEHLFLRPRSHGFSEIYKFEVELPTPLTEPLVELLARVHDKVREPEGAWEYEVDFLSELQSGEMNEEQVLDELVAGSTLSLSIKEFHVSWEYTAEELGDLGINELTPMAELAEQVLDHFNGSLPDVYVDSAEALVQDLNAVAISGENLSFSCTGWEAGD